MGGKNSNMDMAKLLQTWVDKIKPLCEGMKWKIAMKAWDTCFTQPHFFAPHIDIWTSFIYNHMFICKAETHEMGLYGFECCDIDRWGNYKKMLLVWQMDPLYMLTHDLYKDALSSMPYEDFKKRLANHFGTVVVGKEAITKFKQKQARRLADTAREQQRKCGMVFGKKPTRASGGLVKYYTYADVATRGLPDPEGKKSRHNKR